MIQGEILIFLVLTAIIISTGILFIFQTYGSRMQNILHRIVGRCTRYIPTSSTTSNKKTESSSPNSEKNSATPAIDNNVQSILDNAVHKEKEKTQAKKPIKSQYPEPQPLTKRHQKKLEDIRLSIMANRERGKLDDMEKKLIEGLALVPDNTEFLERLADHYFAQGAYIKAMTLLKRLINLQPEHHKAIRQVGQTYIEQNELDTARILIEKAISIKGDNPKYYISLVDIHYTQKNMPLAIKSMEKVLQLRPSKIQYLLGIAQLHEQNAEPSKAYGYYSKIIELDPMNESAKDALTRLS